MLKLTSFVLGMVRACVDDIVPALIATGMYVVHWHLAEGLSAVKESDSGHVFWRRQLPVHSSAIFKSRCNEHQNFY